MATRVLGPTGSRRRRRFLFVSLLIVACTALFLAGAAQAVHDEQFQLDGDVSTHCYNAPAPVTCAKLAYDWGANTAGNTSAQTDTAHSVFLTDPAHANTAAAPCLAPVATETTCEQTTPNPATVPSVFPAASFVRDFQSGSNCTLDSTSLTPCTGDNTTYATGSKDTLGIGIVPPASTAGWQCNHDNNVNSKVDIANAYVAQYTGTNPGFVGDKIFYFGMEKNQNNGTNDIGIWFLHNNAGCSATSGHQNWNGSHHDGDTLVVSEFTQGGGVSTIKAFQWAANAQFPGDKGCIDSNDNPNPAVVVNGTKGCNGLSIGQGGDCKSAGVNDNICATTNANCTSAAKPCSKPWNQTIATPWLSWDKTAGVGNNVIPSPDFIEGGIDITKIFQAAGNPAPSCFNTIVPDTRSSASITATLFDYVVNKIGGCGGGLKTQENAASTREINANGTISSGTDTAKLQITGTGTWGGDLTWYLCGPNVSGCDNTGYVVTTQTVAGTDSQCGGDPNGVCTYTSGTATLTSALGSGEYCWHAHFQPNPASLQAGVDPQDDNGDNECFFVTPKTPTLTTAAVEPLGLLSPTMCGGLADLNGDCSGNVDPTPDNSQAFYGSTNIIGGKLDCNAWASTNDGAAGDGAIDGSDNCTLLAWNGTSNVSITVTAGVFQVADGTALPAIFPNPATPGDHTVAGSSFAWSTDHGRVDANGNGSIDPSPTSSQDCSINVVNTYDVLGSACQGYAIPQGNGLVDLNDDGKITPADSCTTGCFLGHNVSSGFVVAGPVPIGGTIEDVATLSGTANNPDPANPGTNTAFPTINGGTLPADSNISWSLFPPGTGGAADCSTTPITPTGSPIAASGDGVYGPVSYTTNHAGDKVGKYEFVASYPGEGPNNNAPSPTVSCDTTGANGEQVTIVGSASSSSAQRWLPNDRVVLNSTAGTTLHGTLTVTLYKGAFGGTAGNCTVGTGVAVKDLSNTAIAYTFTPNGAASGTAFNTSNTTFFVGTDSDGTADGTDGTYFWLIHYVDNSLTSPTDRCETATISHNDG